MFEQTIETSATPHITVTECMGNLVVRGSEKRQITLHVRGRTDDATLEREGETFTLVARAGCLLTCPTATTLTVGTVRENLQVEQVEGPVTADTVHGNVNLRAVGPTALEQTFGNLRVRQVEGDLCAQTTRGNARVRQVDGSLSLGRVDGNLGVKEIRGELAAEQVRGNVQLELPFSPGLTYRLNANGNLTVRLPADASLRLALRASGGVRSYIPDLVLEEAEGETRGILGAGEASLEAQVGGRVSLQPLGPEMGPAEGLPPDFMADLEGLGATIEARIAEEMAAMSARLEESLGRIDSEEIRRGVERATEQAPAGRAGSGAGSSADRASGAPLAAGQRPATSPQARAGDRRGADAGAAPGGRGEGHPRAGGRSSGGVGGAIVDVEHTEQHQPKWQVPFFTIWTGQALSLVGSRVAQFALVWYLTKTTGSATVLATASVPYQDDRFGDSAGDGVAGGAAAGDLSRPLCGRAHRPLESADSDDRGRQRHSAGYTVAGLSLLD